jgi:citrate lyase beta subunit
MSARRCLLFVPGSRPERFSKAAASGADMVCIDLEDAVAPGDKATARAATLTFLATAPTTCEWVLRINSPRSADGLRDLLALVDGAVPGLIMIPKCADAGDLRIVREVLGERCPSLIALVESAEGLDHAVDIARAERVALLMFGGADFMAELGGTLHETSLLFARSRLAAAAARAGVGAMDVPSLEIRDQAVVAAETRHVAALGFSSKAAIHPDQVATIQQALAPTDSEIDRARRVLDAFRASPHAAIQVDGKLIDRPIVLAAERTLRRAGLPIG